MPGAEAGDGNEVQHEMVVQSDIDRENCGDDAIVGEEEWQPTISDLTTILQSHIGQQRT